MAVFWNLNYVKQGNYNYKYIQNNSEYKLRGIALAYINQIDITVSNGYSVNLVIKFIYVTLWH